MIAWREVARGTIFNAGSSLRSMTLNKNTKKAQCMNANIIYESEYKTHWSVLICIYIRKWMNRSKRSPFFHHFPSSHWRLIFFWYQFDFSTTTSWYGEKDRSVFLKLARLKHNISPYIMWCFCAYCTANRWLYNKWLQ